MSLYVEIGFPKNYKLKDESYYLNKVLCDLRKIGITSNHKLLDYEIILMNPAYVHITEKSKKLVNFYKQKLVEHDIYSIGRYGNWTYCSIEDNIKEAQNLSKLL
jgi:hypothetical protein